MGGMEEAVNEIEEPTAQGEGDAGVRVADDEPADAQRNQQGLGGCELRP